MEFLPKDGSQINRATAVLLGSTFVRLKKAGILTPQALVDDARPVRAPTHKLFEWNDEVAGEKWRLQQASHYLRSVRTVMKSGEKEVEVRAVSTLRDGAGYDFTHRILKDKARRPKLLQQALGELSAFRRRWEHLEELAEVFAAIDKLESK